MREDSDWDSSIVGPMTTFKRKLLRLSQTKNSPCLSINKQEDLKQHEHSKRHCHLLSAYRQDVINGEHLSTVG
jgi:hypothetical protein